MTEELSILREQTRRFLEREFVPHRERWDSAGIVDRAAWRTAGAAGLLCASIPDESYLGTVFSTDQFLCAARGTGVECPAGRAAGWGVGYYGRKIPEPAGDYG
jgi:alkylation response protein AidB-like acyl-CoA dehydrogenase